MGGPGAIEILTLRGGFNTNVVIVGTMLLGLAAGIVGVFALLRKRSMMADALSHATLPGITAGFLLSGAIGIEPGSTIPMLIGALVSGVLGVLGVQLILRHSRLREDAAIGIVLSVFFGFGVLGLSYIQSNAPSGSVGISVFIFGHAASMRLSDVLVMGVLALVALAATLLVLKEFALVSFNEAFAAVDGWPVSLIDLLMMSLVVLVTIAGIQAVGLILVIALLIVPPVAARFWTNRLWLMIAVSGGLGAASGYAGSAVSALVPNQPAGAAIVLAAGAAFAVSFLAAPRGVIATSVRRTRLSLRIAGEHLLEDGHRRGSALLDRGEIDRGARRNGWTGLKRWLVRRWLVGSGLARASIEAGRGGLELTDAGRDRGARVARNHALWEQYLISHADVAPNHVDWSVDQVEHVLSEELVEELERELSARRVAATGDLAVTGGPR